LAKLPIREKLPARNQRQHHMRRQLRKSSSMATTRIMSAIFAFQPPLLRSQAALSRLPQTIQSFQPICSRASCSWVRNSVSQFGRAFPSVQNSREVHVKRVGAFSTSIIRRSRPEDTTSASPKPSHVGSHLCMLFATTAPLVHSRMSIGMIRLEE
jgi:hypothetical protein